LIDLSNLKAPGWQRIVTDLSAPVADDRVFLQRLVSALGQVAGSRQTVLWLVPTGTDGVEPRAVIVWPPTEQAQPAADAGPIEMSHVDEALIPHLSECKAAVRTVSASNQTRVFGLEGQDDSMYDPGQAAKGYLLAVPIPGAALLDVNTPAPVMGAITLLLDARSKQALQTTLALVEVIAGYIFGHWTRQALKRNRASTAALDLATRLIASMNATEAFKGCGLQLVNDLARQLAVDRVALGWIKGPGNVRAKGQSGRRYTEVVAMSDTENLDRRMALVQRLEAAMDECLDQDQTILYPPPQAGGPGGDVVLAQAVTHAHRELASTDARLKAASFPLRVGDPAGERTVGVVTIESLAEGKMELATIELLQAAFDLVAPVLWVRYSDDRSIAKRTVDWAVKTAAWAVGPRNTVWKAVGILVMLATLAAVLVHIPYRIGAPMTLQAMQRRTISAPFDATIESVTKAAQPGETVGVGQPLIQLDTRERRLSVLESRSQIVQYETEADEALKKGDQSAAQQSLARAAQAQARLELLNQQIERSTITAPIAGVVVAGNLKDKVSGSIKLGDKLLEVADLSKMEIIAKVDDRDIGFIEIGQTGQITPKSDPSKEYNFTVSRIVPLAQAAEGVNAFEVRCELMGPLPTNYRPGMEGQAKFDGPSRSLVWIATRRVIDTARVWLWW